MRSKQWALVVILCGGIVFFVTLILFPSLFLRHQGFDAQSISNNSRTNNSLGNVINKTTSGLPVRLKIPKINVDATVEYVGLTPDGAMGVPKGHLDVAWYEAGPHPGNIGSAVIAGHYGRWIDGSGSAFDDLNTLEKGDILSVIDDKGVDIRFVVRDIRTYDENADASDVFGSTDGKAHLNLITCEGVWNKVAKSYPSRRIVFADREGE